MGGVAFDHRSRRRHRQVFRATCEALPKCVRAGVNIVLGDDYGGAVIRHGTYGKELGICVEWAGAEPLEVITTGTVDEGKLAGLPDLARIEAGYIADLIVVDGEPSADIHLLGDVESILAVMRDGQIFIDNVTGAPTPTGGRMFAAAPA